jgi:hypothetical protein
LRRNTYYLLWAVWVAFMDKEWQEENLDIQLGMEIVPFISLECPFYRIVRFMVPVSRGSNEGGRGQAEGRQGGQ